MVGRLPEAAAGRLQVKSSIQQIGPNIPSAIGVENEFRGLWRGLFTLSISEGQPVPL
jgi:hypothetical protein